MNSERSQRGFISISGIFSLLMLIVIAFIGIKLVPPYFNNYQLQDGIQNIALNATYSSISDEEILHNVITRASSIGIDLTPKQVTAHKAAGTVVIIVDYTIPVDLIVEQFDIHFEPSTSNKNITAK